jgi:uncharacterized protein
MYYDSLGYWRWRLSAANHEPIASGEGYSSKQGCLHAVLQVKGSISAPLYEK